MPSDCVFKFDRRDPIYYSGETINGRIKLKTTRPKTVNGIYILFEGEAKVRWEYRSNDYYRGSETYISSQTNIFGEGELPPGIHTYKFCIQLPLECPTSCVQKYGKIFYEVSIVLERSWRFNNVFKQPITVLQTYNLNMYPEMLIPLTTEDIKYICCWPCSSGAVLSTLTIPFGGYAPGQKIHYSLLIDNQSYSYDLRGIDVSLNQIYEFRASSPNDEKKTKKNILDQNYHGEEVRRLSKQLLTGSLIIPPVPPSSRFQRIIKVSYNIVMEYRTLDCRIHPEIEMPVIIGTIPMVQSAENPDHVAEWIPQTPDTPAGAAADLPPNFDNCKPPSFEQAKNTGDQFVDADVNGHNRTDDFIPRYPMYTNFATASAPPDDAPQVPLLSLPQRIRSPSQSNNE